MKKNTFTFIDLFAGIGGFRLAAEKLGGTCLGFSEINQKATETYKLNFDVSEEKELGDITGLEKVPSADLFLGGVPCQSWSVAGSKKGFDDPRGQLWNDTIRLVKNNKPKAFIFENVKGLIDPKHRDALDYIEDSFRSCGYKVQHKLLNAFDYGLPQNRDRIFVVGLRENVKLGEDFGFPYPNECTHRLYQVFDGLQVPENILKKKKFMPRDLFGERIPASRNRFQKSDEMNDFFIMCDTRNGHTTVHSWDIKKTSKREKEICLTILKNRRKSKYGPWDGNPLSLKDCKGLIKGLKKQELINLIKKGILRQEEDGKFELTNTKNSAGINGVYRVFMPTSDVFPTITATGTNDMVATKQITGDTPEEYKQKFIKEIIKKKQYRPITKREAARLQGFPDWFKLHENEKVSNTQMGNAVPINVVYSVINSLLKTGIFEFGNIKEKKYVSV